jgi:hypothetical protein
MLHKWVVEDSGMVAGGSCRPSVWAAAAVHSTDAEFGGLEVGVRRLFDRFEMQQQGGLLPSGAKAINKKAQLISKAIPLADGLRLWADAALSTPQTWISSALASTGLSLASVGMMAKYALLPVCVAWLIMSVRQMTRTRPSTGLNSPLIKSEV